jgi:hypothetical protein
MAEDDEVCCISNGDFGIEGHGETDSNSKLGSVGYALLQMSEISLNTAT